ncbi:unnamed protein product [Orchesella dallaii]|uniref:Uncharacterized protein n=1 Tax=Orchesella dallaii TaxID=48710 RepID=A0ABP1QCR2_9HEXA
MRFSSKNLVFASALCAVSFLQLISNVQCLKVMELMAPYKVRNGANGRYLTASQQGILGLKTGSVSTQPYFGRKEQQWTLTWDPSADDNHDGYRLESRMEYLNQVTTFYPDGSTIAMPNIWEVIELKNGARMFRNKRTRRCLQVLKSRPDVVERTCSTQNRFQHWLLELLDLDKKIGQRRRSPFRYSLPSNEYLIESDEYVTYDDY